MTRPMRVLFTEWRVIITYLTDIIFFHLLYVINGGRRSEELHLSTCIQLVMNFRHLLGFDTKVQIVSLTTITQLMRSDIETI